MVGRKSCGRISNRVSLTRGQRALQSKTDADVLPARVYWGIGALAVAMITFLYWLTTAVNIPLPPL